MPALLIGMSSFALAAAAPPVIQIPLSIQNRQYIYCVDRNKQSKKTIQIHFEVKRVDLFRLRIVNYNANSEGDQLLSLPQFKAYIAKYIQSESPFTSWEMRAAVVAWKLWSSDDRYHTVTLNRINYICAVKID